MTREEMAEKLRDLAWREREYLAAVLDDQENPHVIAQWLEEAAEMLKLVKPSSGEWLYDRPHHFRCSVCDRVEGVAVTMYKYCPHCGSMMFLSETERRKEWAD